MFQIIKPDTNFNFVSKFGISSFCSSLVVIICLVSTFTQIKYGVDFRGGAEIQVKFKKQIDVNLLRKTLKEEGFQINVQSIGDLEDYEYILRVPSNEKNLNEMTDSVGKALKKDFKSYGIDLRKVDIVGPKAGAELRLSGLQAMLWALIAIMIYIGLRFDFKYSPGAIAALFHDVTIILGIFSFMGLEFTLQIVAALLAIIGYSVNDTVIVYDRVRYHQQKYPDRSLKEHINSAVNETLSRTILTSGTTLFVSIIMLTFGGLAIQNFFLAITLGVIVGTYSSIFVAAPVTLFFDELYDKKAVQG